MMRGTGTRCMGFLNLPIGIISRLQLVSVDAVGQLRACSRQFGYRAHLLACRLDGFSLARDAKLVSPNRT